MRHIRLSSRGRSTQPGRSATLLAAVCAVGLLCASCAPEPGAVAGTPSASVPTRGATDVTGAPSVTPEVGDELPTPQAPSAVPAPPVPSGPPATSQPADPANGEVVIVTALYTDGSVEVSAMIPSTSESGGVCTLELVKGNASTETPASAGNGVTYCGLMSLDAPDPADSFRVLYSSSSMRATSAVTSLESVR